MRSSSLQQESLPPFLASFTIVFNVVFFGASFVYLSNSAEFVSSYTALALRLLAGSAFLAGCLLIAIWFLPTRVRRQVTPLLVSIAVASWLQGNLLVWDYGILDGSSIDWQATWYRGAIDALVWATCLLVALFWERLAIKAATTICLSLIAIQTITLFAHLLEDTNEYAPLEFSIDHSNKFSFSARGNVVLLVLDGFQSDIFSEVVSENSEYRDVFAGFTYFRNASAGFSSTYPSIPLILTGEYFDNSMPYQEFIEKAYFSASSMPKRLTEQGYRVDLFPWIRQAVFYDDRVFSNFKRNTETMFDREELLSLLDVSIFRHSPHFLKPYARGKLNWAIPEWMSPLQDLARQPEAAELTHRAQPIFPEKDRKRLRDLRFVENMVRLSTVSNSPPTFKYYHMLGLHPPIRMNDRMEYEELEPSRDNYRRYATGVLKYTEIMLKRFREIGVYEDSLIIIVADHGLSIPLPAHYGGQKIAPGVLKGQAIPLILLKPPGSIGPLKVSDAPVTLADVPPTVLKTLNMGSTAQIGLSMTEASEDDDRERFFYSYQSGNWGNDYLRAMLEIKASGFSWMAESWKPTGRVLQPRNSIEKFVALLEQDEFLGEPDLYTETPEILPEYFYGISEFDNEESPGLELNFPAADPGYGDLVGLLMPIQKLSPGGTYSIRFEFLSEVHDKTFLERLDARFSKTVFLGNTAIDFMESGQRTSDRWLLVNHTFVAESPDTWLRMELNTVGEPEKGWLWGKAAKIGIRNLEIRQQNR